MPTMEDQSFLRRIAAALLAVSLLLLLTGCVARASIQHHFPARDRIAGQGEQFINSWNVEKVYHVDTNEVPMNVGDQFKLIPASPHCYVPNALVFARDSGCVSKINMQLIGNLSANKKDWAELQTIYIPGRKAGPQSSLIADTNSENAGRGRELKAANRSVENFSDNDQVVAVESAALSKSYLTLRNKGLEFLKGSLTSNGESGNIKIYRVGNNKTATNDLFIFYCQSLSCDKGGMIHARPISS